MTAFSNKVTRSPLIRGHPAFMPGGCGRQHTSWVSALERVKVVEIVDLTGSDQQRGHIVEWQPGSNGSDRAHGLCLKRWSPKWIDIGGYTPKELKGDRVRDGADSDDRSGDGSDNNNSSTPRGHPLRDEA